ncbi:hypothetical protein HL41_04605 [Thermodesulfobacterium commune DSM 2178]|uniref:Uncharacterized protein n=3 Tax=Thermodesulfobacterium commune TaxID=1741 RepID=A0A075WTD2_9BACT|nr:hypothetical protein HL41_04605 [Thermodesulfobacterium commune DSM 2178]
MLEAMKKSTQKMERDFEQVGSLIAKLVGEIDKKNTIIFNTISDLLGKVQFQDVVRQRLEKFCEVCSEISEYSRRRLRWVDNPDKEEKPEEIKVLVEKMKQDYIMADQRRVHAEVFNEETKIKEEAPKIELFKNW